MKQLQNNGNSQQAGPGSLFSSALEELGTLPGMQEVLGNQFPGRVLTCIGASPHFLRLDRSQKSLPFPNHILLLGGPGPTPVLPGIPRSSLGSDWQGKALRSLTWGKSKRRPGEQHASKVLKSGPQATPDSPQPPPAAQTLSQSQVTFKLGCCKRKPHTPLTSRTDVGLT